MTDARLDVMARLRRMREEAEDAPALAPGVMFRVPGPTGGTYLVVDAIGTDWRCLRVSYDSQFAQPADVVCDTTDHSVGARRIHGERELVVPRTLVEHGFARVEDVALIDDARACIRSRSKEETLTTTYPRGRRQVDAEAQRVNEAHQREHEMVVQTLANAARESVVSVVIDTAKKWWQTIGRDTGDALVFSAESVSDDVLEEGLLNPENELTLWSGEAGRLCVLLVPDAPALAIWLGSEPPETTVFSASDGICHAVRWAADGVERFAGAIPWAPGSSYFVSVGEHTLHVTFPD